MEKVKERKKPFFYVAIIFLIYLLLFFLSTTGCDKTDIKTVVKNKFTSEDEMDAAVEVVKNFFDYLESGEYDKAYELLNSEDKNRHSFDEFEKDLKTVTKIIDIEINWVEVKNNTAKVGIDLTDIYDNEEKVYKDMVVSLIKEEDGKWGINYWD